MSGCNSTPTAKASPNLTLLAGIWGIRLTYSEAPPGLQPGTWGSGEWNWGFG